MATRRAGTDRGRLVPRVFRRRLGDLHVEYHLRSRKRGDHCAATAAQGFPAACKPACAARMCGQLTLAMSGCTSVVPCPDTVTAACGQRLPMTAAALGRCLAGWRRVAGARRAKLGLSCADLGVAVACGDRLSAIIWPERGDRVGSASMRAPRAAPWGRVEAAVAERRASTAVQTKPSRLCTQAARPAGIGHPWDMPGARRRAIGCC